MTKNNNKSISLTVYNSLIINAGVKQLRAQDIQYINASTQGHYALLSVTG